MNKKIPRRYEFDPDTIEIIGNDDELDEKKTDKSAKLVKNNEKHLSDIPTKKVMSESTDELNLIDSDVLDMLRDAGFFDNES